MRLSGALSRLPGSAAIVCSSSLRFGIISSAVGSVAFPREPYTEVFNPLARPLSCVFSRFALPRSAAFARSASKRFAILSSAAGSGAFLSEPYASVSLALNGVPFRESPPPAAPTPPSASSQAAF